MTVTANSIITPQTVNSPAANVLLSTAMTSTKAFEGTDTAGTALALIYTAGANGSKPPNFVNICYAGTTAAAPSGTSNATVVRFFANNNSVNTTATNNIFIGEVAVPSMVYSNTAGMPSVQFSLANVMPVMPANWRIYAGLTTAMGGTACALAVSAPGGGDL